MHRDRNPKWSYKVKALTIGMAWHDGTMGEVFFWRFFSMKACFILKRVLGEENFQKLKLV